MYKALAIIGVTLEEKSELEAYQLKGIAQIWFIQWKMGRLDDGCISWAEFKATFLDRFLPIQLREAKMMEFMNFRKSTMSVRKYSLKFTNLLEYAPNLVFDP